MKTIKDMPEHDRPREKIADRGPSALTDEELVQVILGRGVEGHDVRAMSKVIAKIIREKKTALAEADLTAIRGMGPAKAYQILASISTEQS